jgi:hypothetical protein
VMLSFAIFSTAVQATCHADSTYMPGCFCYSQSEVDKLAGSVVDLKKCQAEVFEKTRLINERLIDFKGPQENRLWWQEPGIVGLGMVGSFVFGTVLAYSVSRR